MSMSKMLELPSDYGLVLVVAVGHSLINYGLIFRVMKARKEYAVEYPDLYAPESNKNAKEFNCVQRSHQNYLEGQPQFLFYLLMGGLQYPRVAAGLGLLHSVGRILYTCGYCTGDPAKRKPGGPALAVSGIGLQLCALSFIYRTVGVRCPFSDFVLGGSN